TGLYELLNTEYDQDRDECPECGCPEADVVEQGGVGWFWGYRGLQRALAVRHVLLRDTVVNDV
ncbi:MAG TPA: hypothetical protein VFD47_06740, partial [Actinomycetota bacterium]|nr:hypothetical protein [Actinomycetota bacterium]